MLKGLLEGKDIRDVLVREATKKSLIPTKKDIQRAKDSAHKSVRQITSQVHAIKDIEKLLRRGIAFGWYVGEDEAKSFLQKAIELGATKDQINEFNKALKDKKNIVLEGQVFYLSRTMGAYGGGGRSIEEIYSYLKFTKKASFSYATSEGFGPGYVNLSAVLWFFYIATAKRDLTDKEVDRIGGSTKRYSDKAEFEKAIKDRKRIAADYRKKIRF